MPNSCNNGNDRLVLVLFCSRGWSFQKRWWRRLPGIDVSNPDLINRLCNLSSFFWEIRILGKLSEQIHVEINIWHLNLNDASVAKTKWLRLTKPSCIMVCFLWRGYAKMVVYCVSNLQWSNISIVLLFCVAKLPDGWHIEIINIIVSTIHISLIRKTFSSRLSTIRLN